MAYDPRPSTPIKHLTESNKVCSVAWAKCLLLSQPYSLHLAMEVFGVSRGPGVLLSSFGDSSLPSCVAALALGNTVSLQSEQFPFALLCSESNQQRLLGQKGEVPAAAGGSAGLGGGRVEPVFFVVLFLPLLLGCVGGRQAAETCYSGRPRSSQHSRHLP